MTDVFNDMARSSVSNGLGAEGKAASHFTGAGWKITMGPKRRITHPWRKGSYVCPDLVVTKDGREMLVEVKSNGEARGTLFGKWWYSLDLYKQLDVPAIIVIYTSCDFDDDIARLKELAKGSKVRVLHSRELDEALNG